MKVLHGCSYYMLLSSLEQLDTGRAKDMRTFLHGKSGDGKCGVHLESAACSDAFRPIKRYDVPFWIDGA
jgi:hypothetical protein